MKKYISSIIILFVVNLSYGQTESNYAAPGGGGSPNCNCTAPSNSSCNADCLFSSCCICWNPNTQTGACGCYWGVATCRNGNNASSSTMNSSNFGELNPDAHIKFSFEKFNLLFDFFKSKDINTETLKARFNNIKSTYVVTTEKVAIANSDFALILNEYSKLIDLLNLKQKEDLNIYINSLK
jgi:hypothetical protein